jgi:hypothetical protein
MDSSRTKAAAAADTTGDSGVRWVGGAAKGKTFQEALGLREVAVPLVRLPDAVAFAADFPEPIAFDPDRRLLKYRGPMYHSSYVFLRAQSSDPEYDRALEQLFVATAAPDRPATSRWWIIAGSVAAIVGLAVLAVLVLWLR